MQDYIFQSCYLVSRFPDLYFPPVKVLCGQSVLLFPSHLHLLCYRWMCLVNLCRNVCPFTRQCSANCINIQATRCESIPSILYRNLFLEIGVGSKDRGMCLLEVCWRSRFCCPFSSAVWRLSEHVCKRWYCLLCAAENSTRILRLPVHIATNISAGLHFLLLSFAVLKCPDVWI